MRASCSAPIACRFLAESAQRAVARPQTPFRAMGKGCPNARIPTPPRSARAEDVYPSSCSFSAPTEYRLPNAQMRPSAPASSRAFASASAMSRAT